MDKLFKSLRGYTRVHIDGASPEWFLNELAKERIPFWNLRWIGALELEIHIFSKDYPAAALAAEKTMCVPRQLPTATLRDTAGTLLRRKVLIVALLCSLFILFLIPSFLLFYTVSGNEHIESEQILRELEKLDIHFGSRGDQIVPKWIKDHILNMLPELQWITVVQNGCKAEVIVRERPDPPNMNPRKGLANVIAAESGMILEQSIYAGQQMKEVGDVVSKGDLLVSGVVDLERTFAIEYARADIFAQTWKKYDVKFPGTYQKKGAVTNQTACVWLEVGKNRIKIFGNSGIYAGPCDKMITRKVLSLPGCHQLPVALLIETFSFYLPEAGVATQAEATKIMCDFIQHYTLERMYAGEILQTDTDVQNCGAYYSMKVRMACKEMIARTVETKWNEKDFEHD